MRQAQDAQQACQGSTRMHQPSVMGTWSAIVLAIALPGALLSGCSGQSAGSDEQAIATRIQPIGTVELSAATGGGGNRTGEEVFKAVCAGCHATGAMGSPKFGDAAAWGPRIATGYDALLHSALNGKNAMPAKGGASDLAEVEVARAVVYMANDAGAKFPEPKAPAEAASGAASGAQ